MFKRAAWRLRELKALEASTNKIPSVPSSAKISLIEWTAASQPARWPAHNWRQPEASMTSCFTTRKTALAMIRLEVSPMPMGLTPGFLSRAIKRQFKRGCKASGSVKEVEIRFATRANEWQRSEEAALY